MAADENSVLTPHVTFGEFRLDCKLKRLYRGTKPIKLTLKPFSTLEFLISNRDRVVSKEELLRDVWRVNSGRNAVEQAVEKLRKALGDDVSRPQYIETISGQGYHFIATVLPHNTITEENTATGNVGTNTSVSARATRPLADTPDRTSASDVRVAAMTDHVLKATSAKSHWRMTLIFLGGLSALALGFFFVFGPIHEPNPQHATVVGAELTALDGAGNAIWRYRFPEPLQPTVGPLFSPNQNTQTHVEDLNGDGKNEVLVAAAYSHQSEANYDELYCFASSGRLLWRYQPHAEFNFVGRKASGPWKLHSLAIVPEDGKKVVWAAFTDPVFAPAIVASIDANGRSGIRYVSSGNVNSLIGVANEKGTFILAGGINNEYRAASVAVLDSRQAQAASPQTPGNRFQCTNCPNGRPFRYILLPRSEVNVGAGKPYNWVNSLERHGGGILVSVLEQEETELGSSVREFFELSDDLIPKNISFGADYREAHERLERRGLIAHKWPDCQEQKHSAIARVWDAAQGWREVQIPWVH